MKTYYVDSIDGNDKLIAYNNIFYSSRTDMVISKGYNSLWEVIVEDTCLDVFYNNIFISCNNPDYGQNTVYDHNCYYGINDPITSAPARDIHKIISDPLLKGHVSSKDCNTIVDGYKLRSKSPCINASKVIDNNGGRDFYGNYLHNKKIDIGCYQFLR